MDTERRYEEANRVRLQQCREAVAAADPVRARALLDDLHWFAHDDPAIHRAIHRLEWQLARDAGDVRAAARSILPNLFAGVIARLERLSPSYYAEVHVDAPRDVVYRVITDLDRYHEWNPWLVSAKGRADKGASVVAEVVLRDATRSADHEVTVTVPGERFAWRDSGPITILAGGSRMRMLLDEDGGTRLVVRLALSGPLARFVHAFYGPSLVRGLRAETEALAARAALLATRSEPGVVHA